MKVWCIFTLKLEKHHNHFKRKYDVFMHSGCTVGNLGIRSGFRFFNVFDISEFDFFLTNVQNFENTCKFFWTLENKMHTILSKLAQGNWDERFSLISTVFFLCWNCIFIIFFCLIVVYQPYTIQCILIHSQLYFDTVTIIVVYFTFLSLSVLFCIPFNEIDKNIQIKTMQFASLLWYKSKCYKHKKQTYLVFCFIYQLS